MRVYIAGPMTGLPGHNFAAFEHWARQLRLAGHDVVSPRELSGHSLEEALAIPWEHHLRRDLQEMLGCEGVVVMDGWARSRGALLEVETAMRVGMPVHQTRRTGPEATDLELERLDETTLVMAVEAGRAEDVEATLRRINETVDAAGLRPEFEARLAAQEVVTDPATGAMKADGRKPRTDLLPVGPLMDVARVLEFGAVKYSPSNWRKGMDWSRMYGAALRHLMTFWDGEERDPETGLSHLAHALCCTMFLLEYVREGTGNDDRWTTTMHEVPGAPGQPIE